MAKRKVKLMTERQEMLCFQYHEHLESILKDLEWIDKVIPRESSRYAPASLSSERDAIIQGRKHDLLAYIQTICRDHMLYSKRLFAMGRKDAPWKPALKPVKSGATTRPYFREDQVGWKD
jgi:hypothetical protein